MFDIKTFKSHLTTRNSSFGRVKRSSLHTLVDLVSAQHRNLSKIHDELNKIPLDKAQKYQAGLQYLADELRMEYMGLVPNSFSAGFTGDFNVKMSSDEPKVLYTSPHFHARATLYCIVPRSHKYRIGFIQICNRRTQEHRYYGTTTINGWRITQSFPISDSSSTNNIPFYHVGVGYACSTHTAKELFATLAGLHTLEIDDNFNECGVYIHPVDFSKKKLIPNTSLKQIRRDQKFTAWLGALNMSTQTVRLFKCVEYRFDFEINFEENKPNAPKVANRHRAPVITTPMATASLPPAALNPPTMNDVDTFFVQ